VPPQDGAQKALSRREYLSVMRDSKFCLAPAGMGFATRAAEAVSQARAAIAVVVAQRTPARQ